MRFATPRLLTCGREEREAKLKDFIVKDMASRSAAGPAFTYTLIARGPDSPVARAAASLAGDFAAANVTLRAVLLDLDTMTLEAGRPSVLDMDNADIRLLTDVRFNAAHEQFVLNATDVWLGDCMRRDPTKRDAFEIFHESNAQAAQHAAKSFEKLWASAQPVRRVRPIAPELMYVSQGGEDALPAPRR